MPAVHFMLTPKGIDQKAVRQNPMKPTATRYATFLPDRLAAFECGGENTEQ